jgi:hypothetical protein
MAAVQRIRIRVRKRKLNATGVVEPRGRKKKYEWACSAKKLGNRRNLNSITVP